MHTFQRIKSSFVIYRHQYPPTIIKREEFKYVAKVLYYTYYKIKNRMRLKKSFYFSTPQIKKARGVTHTSENADLQKVELCFNATSKFTLASLMTYIKMYISKGRLDESKYDPNMCMYF